MLNIGKYIGCNMNIQMEYSISMLFGLKFCLSNHCIVPGQTSQCIDTFKLEAIGYIQKKIYAQVCNFINNFNHTNKGNQLAKISNDNDG